MKTNHIKKYAYSHHQDILGVITCEINNTYSILQDISVPTELFSPKVQMVYQCLSTYKSKTEEIATSIDLNLQRIKQMEQHPAFQEIAQLEIDIKHNTSPLLSNSLNRELRHLKSIHAHKISARITIQQNIILKRSTLVQNWRSVLADEIMILEESKNLLIDKIMNVAHQS